jgi:hypothetical protein
VIAVVDDRVPVDVENTSSAEDDNATSVPP